MENPNFFSILPASVRYDSKLTDFAKILFCEITALANKHGYCFATNKYFEDLYQRKQWTISSSISLLIKQGYIRSEVESTNTRRLYPLVNPPLVKNHKGGSEKSLTGGSEKSLHNNTSINNKIEGAAKAAYSIEEVGTKQRSKAKPSYEKMLIWLRDLTGAPLKDVGKQYKYLKLAEEYKYSPDELRRHAEKLWDDSWFRSHGMDWKTVVDSIDKTRV